MEVLPRLRAFDSPGALGYTPPVPIPTEPIGSIPRPMSLLEAAEFVPLDRLGTTDDCGFAPFSDDTSTARETAFEKIRVRVLGTEMAAKKLGIS